MKTQTIQNNPATRAMLRGGMLILAVTFMFGCGGHYGRLSASQTVKMQFENYEVLPDHRYYYSGSEARPRAVIGVHEATVLQSDLWVPVELTSDRLRGWVDYFGPNAKHFQGNNGAAILTEDGRKIGVWYAFIDWRDWAAVKMIDANTVSITTPIVSSETTLMFKYLNPNTEYD